MSNFSSFVPKRIPNDIFLFFRYLNTNFAEMIFGIGDSTVEGCDIHGIKVGQILPTHCNICYIHDIMGIVVEDNINNNFFAE